MKTSHVVFNFLGLLIAAFLILSALGIFFIVMPSTQPESRGIWHFTMAVETIIILLLGGGGVMNFARGRLLAWPTAGMILGYCISIWLLPLAIWGGILLVYSNRGKGGNTLADEPT